MIDMHVLMLPSWYDTADRPYAGTFFRDWASSLQAAGARVGVAYVEGRSLRRFSLRHLAETHFQTTAGEEGGLQTIRLKGWNTLAQWTLGGLVWARLAQHALRAYLERFGRPDIIAAQSTLWAGHGARHAKRHWRLPYAITEVNTAFGTGDVRGWRAAISRRVFAEASAVIAISTNLRNRLVELGGAEHVEIVPCTVDAAYWMPPLAARGRSPFTFYAQAHLVPHKGFDLLIRAFASRFRGAAGVRMVIGGDGVIRQALEALAQGLGVHGQVQFLGALPRNGVRQAMWDANCFVLPSLAENFGVVLIEALATGLPVISTRCGGPEDIITPEVGVLLEPGDEQGLADAMVAMLDSPGCDPEALRAHAVGRYGYATVGARLRDVYQRALGVD